MKAQTFTDAVESTAKVFGRKDVRVIFAGSEAHTNGETVVLPALPSMADVTEQQAMVIRGYRDHEAMHVRCTDTSPARLTQLGQLKADSMLFDLTQYCEDIRIENAGIQEYAGMKLNLSALMEAASYRVGERLKMEGPLPEVLKRIPLAKQYGVAIQALARKKIGENIGFYEEFLQHVDPRVLALAERMANEAVALPTGFDGAKLDSDLSKLGTQNAFELAAKMKQAFIDEIENAPPPEEQPEEREGGDGRTPSDDEGDNESERSGKDEDEQDQGEGEDSGEEGEGEEGAADDEADDDGGEDEAEGEDGDDGDGDGDDADDADADDDAGESGSTDSDGDGSAKGNPSNDGESDDGEKDSPQDAKGGGHGTEGISELPEITDVDADFKDALKDTVNDIESAAKREMQGDSDDSQVIPWRRMSNSLYSKFVVDGGDIDAFNQIEHTIRDKTAMIRRTLEMVLQARSDRRWQGGNKRGRLQSMRLVEAIRGAENVYAKREDGRDMDTVVRLSIDGSGSMNGTYIQQAAQLAIALTEALERTGCEMEVEVWNDTMMNRDNIHSAKIIVAPTRAEAIEAREQREAHNQRNADMHNKRDHARRNRLPLPPEPAPLFTSVGTLTVKVMKTARERITDPKVRARMGLIPMMAGGSTPMVEAVSRSLPEMALMKHGKRILIVMTDGDTNGVYEGSEESNTVQMKVLNRMADKHGIHLIGVGIEHNVGQHFNNSLKVTSKTMYQQVISKIAGYLAEESQQGRFLRAA